MVNPPGSPYLSASVCPCSPRRGRGGRTGRGMLRDAGLQTSVCPRALGNALTLSAVCRWEIMARGELRVLQFRQRVGRIE